MKLVVLEAETEALHRELRAWPTQLTSVVGDVEVRRAARRAPYPTDVEAVLAEVTLVELDAAVREVAVAAGAPSLRSLDAIHLATALSLADAVGAFCSYDRRLAAEAEAAGLTVVAPGP